VHPALLPGGRRVEDASERGEVEAVWGAGSVPERPGRDAAAILQAAANREIDVLYLIGVDPLRDFPDAALAMRAMENVELKVVQDVVAGPMAPFADVMLPAAPWIERDGEHVTNWEGRSQRLHAVRGPLPMSRPDWQILRELSEVLGRDIGLGSLEHLQRERASLLGAERDVDLSGLGRSSTGAALGGPGEELLLFTYPLLVDDGTLARQASALKEALGEPAFVEVHASDAQRLGLADGGTADVRTPAGAAEGLPVRVSEDIAVGTAFVPFNNPGLAANTLLSGRFTAMATVSAGAASAEGAG
jgi:NADH-quinone oxidoreductase subunit G